MYITQIIEHSKLKYKYGRFTPQSHFTSIFPRGHTAMKFVSICVNILSISNSVNLSNISAIYEWVLRNRYQWFCNSRLSGVLCDNFERLFEVIFWLKFYSKDGSVVWDLGLYVSKNRLFYFDLFTALLTHL